MRTLAASVHYVCNQAQTQRPDAADAVAGRTMMTEEKTMNSTDWITGNDLSLTFDRQGRLWHFRSTTDPRPSGARSSDGTDLVVTVEAPGVRPGDLDVQLEDAVLHIMDSAGERPTATRVGLPRRVELHTLQTAYGDGTFEVRVPLVPATVVNPAPEAVPIAC